MVDTDDTRRTIDDGRRTTPGVWHKLPTGELKTLVCGAFELICHKVILNFMKFMKLSGGEC